jgi:diguanylate cyclase (GGDEF)-like protein
MRAGDSMNDNKKYLASNNEATIYETIKRLLLNDNASEVRAEILGLFEAFYGSYLGKVFMLQIELLKNKNAYDKAEVEYARTLSLLFQNESQNMKLMELNKKLSNAYRKLETINRTDDLTRILNRKHLIRLAELELKRTSRIREKTDIMVRKTAGKALKRDKKGRMKREPEALLGVFTTAILDVDDFKKVNDFHGHLVGDIVLKRIGKILMEKNLFRNTDIVGRFGGDEFIIILPDTPVKNALIPMNKLLHIIRKEKFKVTNNETVRITVSAGVSAYRPSDKSINSIIQRADKALYFAKKHGKDQVVAG